MATSQQASSKRSFRFGPFELRLPEGELRKGDAPRVRSQGQPLRILVELLCRANTLVTREELRLTMQCANNFVDSDVGLNTAIRKLRHALGDDADRPRYIEKFPRQGYRFIASVLDVAARSAERATDSHKNPSVAVLPFLNLSSDPENQYFCEGLSEDLISALARLNGLDVASRTSALRFRGDPTDIREIGRQLNVASVLEGSVRRAGSRLRIAAQLISVSNGFHLWSERYDVGGYGRARDTRFDRPGDRRDPGALVDA